MAYPGFQRGGCLWSGPIRKARGGGGDASAHSLLPFNVLQLKYNTKVQFFIMSAPMAEGGARVLTHPEHPLWICHWVTMSAEKGDHECREG